MKCKNCKKEITDNEVFCEECKELLKETSSTEQVEELEELIEERKNSENLEITKELPNISDLVKENKSVNNEIDEDFKDVKENKLLNIILIFVIGILLGFSIFMAHKFLNRPKKVEEPPKQTINYEKIINEYGDLVKAEASKYIKENNEIPTWQVLSDLVIYDNYEINCQTHNVYIDGSIYLEHCKVNNKTVKYTYGTFVENAKSGKEIKIYKDNNFYVENETDTLIGSVVCNTINCEFYKAFNKYIIVKEKDAYYLYNYDTNTLEFGPFNDFILLNYNDELYGVYYDFEGQKNIYNVSLGKTLKNIKGSVDFNKDYVDTGIQYKYGYMITMDNGYNFINLKTGNVSFNIKDDIKSFVEDIKAGILYILVPSSNGKFKVYNSNGKLMFNGAEFINFKVLDNSLLTVGENVFKIYDSKLNVKLTSNTYNKILRVYDDFIIVVDKKVLKLVDYNDSVIAIFDKEWNDGYKVFDKTYDYNKETNILKINFENDFEDKEKAYTVYSYNFLAKLTNVEELDTIE